MDVNFLFFVLSFDTDIVTMSKLEIKLQYFVKTLLLVPPRIFYQEHCESKSVLEQNI